MDKIVRIFFQRLAQKPCVFYTSVAAISSSENIDEPLFFAMWLRMLISFLSDVDILEFNSSFGKYYPLHPQNP